MRTIYNYAVALTVGLLGLAACSSNDDTSTKTAGANPIAQPRIIVRDLTTSTFSLRWEAVPNADSYVYTFNGGAEIPITDCQIEFTGLERQKEYVVAVKACPGNDTYTASPFTYIHVLTDDLEKLPAPIPTLGCAYASKTIVTWSETPETELYEYSIGDKVYTTSERMVTLTGLEKGAPYLFAVRAMTADATRFGNSEAAELEFTISEEDIPSLLVVPTEVIADAVKVDIYAPNDLTYFYDAVPLASFAKRTPEQIMETYRQAIIKYAKDKGISLQLAMASMLKSGTQSLQIKGLMPELSYVVLAFGMDLKGEITTSLTSTRFKTMSEDYTNGPNYGGSDWFQQRLFITNAFVGATGYGWTNSVWNTWKGQRVINLRHRTLPTATFLTLFPDPENKQAVVEFLQDDNYAYTLDSQYLPEVNSDEGTTLYTTATPGTSYTQAAVATSSSGQQTLCVNSVITRTGTSIDTWFQTKAFTNAAQGPTHNTFIASMFGTDITSARYALFQASALDNVRPSDYPRLIEQLGYDVDPQYIPNINGMGFAILFSEIAGVEASTSYVFMATGTNSVGDKRTSWASVTTTAAPTLSAAKTAASTFSAGALRSLVGEPIIDPGKSIFPSPGIPLPKDARPEGDLWTIIHNMQILN